MPREHLGIRVGDLIRSPDRSTARYHKVLRVGRRKDGTHYITLRTSRIWRALGLSSRQHLEWAALKAIGYGIKRSAAALPTAAIQPTPAEEKTGD